MSSRYTEAFICTLANADGVTSSGTVMDGTQAATTGAQTYTPICVKNCDLYSFQYTLPAGSTLVGTLTVQVSNDRGQQSTNEVADVTVGNWDPIQFFNLGTGARAANVAVATGANGLTFGDVTCMYRWVRLVFAFTSGSGSPRITFQQKGWP